MIDFHFHRISSAYAPKSPLTTGLAWLGLEEAFSSNPVKESDHVREDAYKISIKPVNDKEVNYPYVSISYYVLSPIEKRYESLNPYEIATYYTEHHSAVPFYPKAYDYYQAILTETDSVEIALTERTGRQWAYNKFVIKIS